MKNSRIIGLFGDTFFLISLFEQLKNKINFFELGMRQGLLQSKLGVAHIISRFEVKLENNTPVELEHRSVLLSAKGGLFLNIRKIDKKSN